jgi:hypothetical protein
MKGAQQIRSAVRTIRSEPEGDGCEWVMVVDLNGVGFTGAPKRGSWQMRLQLDLSGPAGAPRVRNVSRAVKH